LAARRAARVLDGADPQRGRRGRAALRPRASGARLGAGQPGQPYRRGSGHLGRARLQPAAAKPAAAP
jgi:hypothetical protein